MPETWQYHYVLGVAIADAMPLQSLALCTFSLCVRKKRGHYLPPRKQWDIAKTLVKDPIDKILSVETTLTNSKTDKINFFQA